MFGADGRAFHRPLAISVAALILAGVGLAVTALVLAVAAGEAGQAPAYVAVAVGLTAVAVMVLRGSRWVTRVVVVALAGQLAAIAGTLWELSHGVDGRKAPSCAGSASIRRPGSWSTSSIRASVSRCSAGSRRAGSRDDEAGPNEPRATIRPPEVAFIRKPPVVRRAEQGTGIVSDVLWGYLTLVALAFALAFASIAAVYVRRLEGRPPNPISDEIGSAKTVVRKVRRREPMSPEELDYARQLVAARSSPMAFSIPGALFMVGCFYVFGSLYHLHGATPSERTFLGVFPMLASMNFTTQILRSARLKRRLRKMS